MRGCDTCWTLSAGVGIREMVGKKPYVDEVKALRRCYHLLLPTLANTYWPSSEDMPYVERRWPSEQNIALQYVRLRNGFCRRPRNPCHTRLYTRVSQYCVHNIRAAPIVEASLRLLFGTPLRIASPKLRVSGRWYGTNRIFMLVRGFCHPSVSVDHCGKFGFRRRSCAWWAIRISSPSL